MTVILNLPNFGKGETRSSYSSAITELWLGYCYGMAQLVKNPPAMWEAWVWSLGWEFSIPGLGRSPGEGKGYPLQYSGLENSIDCIVHGIAKSRTRLIDFHFHFPSFITNYGETDDLHSNGRKRGGTEELLDEGEEEWKRWLKAQLSEN